MNKFTDTKLPTVFAEENSIEPGAIICWCESQESFQLYIFSALFETTKVLEDLWEVLNDDIAVDFQSTLTIDVESWNIYVVYLVKEQVSRELKYKIEQDKFSCRKLVFDNFNNKQWSVFLKDETSVARFIADRLFKIDIDKQVVTNEENLDTILRKEHGNLLDIINRNSEKINYKPVFDEFLKNYGQKD
jgi:hypothetical protein